jgi:integrase
MRVNLTAELIAEGLRCPDGLKKAEFVHTGAETRGVYIEVARGTPGVGVYRFRYKCPASKTTKHLRIGSTTEISLLDAMAKAREYRARLDAGLEPVVEENPLPTMPTFREFFFQTYITIVRERKRSWKRDEEIFRLRLGDIADMRLDQITKLDLMKLHNKLKASGLAAATSNHGLKVARQALGLAVSLDVISKNVASGIPLFREDNAREKFLSAEELGRLIKVLQSDKNRNVCRILLTAMFTGARIGEVLSCRYSDLDFKNTVWLIRAASTKTRRSRHLPLNDSAIDVLKEGEDTKQSDYVFTNPRTGRPYTTISKVWERLRAEAGLQGARIHDLRHAWASLLGANQESAFTIAQLMGHSSVVMSQRYTHLGQATLLEASNRAAKRIQEAITESA